MHITILRKDIGDFHLWNADFRLTGMVISNGRTGDGFHSGILILRKNKEWTQAQLADALSVSESAVQKWETDKNTPPISEVKRLAEVFYLPTTTLIDDTVEIPEFFLLESLAADEFWPRPAALDSTPHKVYDAGLIKNANLHRFLNKAGVPYSAIYVGRNEMLSCERDTSRA